MKLTLKLKDRAYTIHTTDYQAEGTEVDLSFKP